MRNEIGGVKTFYMDTKYTELLPLLIQDTELFISKIGIKLGGIRHLY